MLHLSRFYGVQPVFHTFPRWAVKQASPECTGDEHSPALSRVELGEIFLEAGKR